MIVPWALEIQVYSCKLLIILPEAERNLPVISPIPYSHVTKRKTLVLPEDWPIFKFHRGSCLCT
jgi:hypothetical protein